MNNKEYEAPIQRGLLKPTLQVTVFSILGIIVRFVTQIIVAAKFGATIERDAYFAAVVFPTYITAVLVGSLTLIFVPMFIEYETKKNKEEAWKVASILINLIFLVLFGISLLGFIFAKQLISVTTPGFKGEELSLTAALLRIIFPSIIFSGMIGLLSSMYYAHHRFLRPAITSAISTLLMLSSVVVLTHFWGIKSLAFGYLVGEIAGFFILVPILFKQDRYRFSFDFHNEGVRQIIKLMSPLVFAGLFYRATTVIERMIASTLPTGSISYLGYANRIISILTIIATTGIPMTIFPIIAKSWAENDLVRVREHFARGIRIMMLVTFPIAMVFVVLRVPIIQVIFERGAFDHRTTLAVADILMILLIGFMFYGLGNVVRRGFYVSQKTKLAAIIGIVGVTLYILLAHFLAETFSYRGLAIADSAWVMFDVTVGMIVMRRIFGGVNGKKILEGLTRILIASLCGGVATYCSFKMVFVGDSLMMRSVVSAIMGIVIYTFLVIYILKLEEALLLKKKLLDKLRSLQIWRNGLRGRNSVLSEDKHR